MPAGATGHHATATTSRPAPPISRRSGCAPTTPTPTTAWPPSASCWGTWPSAAYHFKEVTRLDPLRAGAYINLGAVYNRLEQYDDAVTALRRGIQLDLNRAEGYYNLGLVYRRKGQADLAIQAYREAVRVNPRMADAHYNIANIYYEKDQYALAIAHYKQSLEIRPHWEKAQRGLAAAQEAAGESSAAGEDTGYEPTTPQPGDLSSKPLDPERQLDGNLHGELLRHAPPRHRRYRRAGP